MADCAVPAFLGGQERLEGSGPDTLLDSRPERGSARYVAARRRLRRYVVGVGTAPFQRVQSGVTGRTA